MTIVGEMQDKVRYQALAVVTLGTLTTLVAQSFLRIKLFALFQL